MDRSQRIVIVVLAALFLFAVSRRHLVSTESVLFFAALIPSVILHEVTHGVAALAFGDDTAKRAGRITLNPVRHVDPVGTVVLPAILLLTSGIAFGYAKPVPVNQRRMRSPRNHGLLTALAGPFTNIVLAGLAALVLGVLAPPDLAAVKLAVSHGQSIDFTGSGWSMLARLVFEVGFANTILAAFNLIPLPPLDGSAVIERILPVRLWPGYLRLRQYAMPILLLVVLFSGSLLNHVFRPAMSLWSRAL